MTYCTLLAPIVIPKAVSAIDDDGGRPEEEGRRNLATYMTSSSPGQTDGLMNERRSMPSSSTCLCYGLTPQQERSSSTSLVVWIACIVVWRQGQHAS